MRGHRQDGGVRGPVQGRYLLVERWLGLGTHAGPWGTAHLSVASSEALFPSTQVPQRPAVTADQDSYSLPVPRTFHEKRVANVVFPLTLVVSEPTLDKWL